MVLPLNLTTELNLSQHFMMETDVLSKFLPPNNLNGLLTVPTWCPSSDRTVSTGRSAGLYSAAAPENKVHIISIQK